MPKPIAFYRGAALAWVLAASALGLHQPAAAQALPAPFMFSSGTATFGPSWVATEAEGVAGRTGTSLGNLQYAFRIDGPATVEVPIRVDYYFGGEASVQWDGPTTAADLASTAIATSVIAISDYYSTYKYIERLGSVVAGGPNPRSNNMGAGSFELLLESNALYRVSLGSTASATPRSGVSAGFLAQASSYTDPYISIGASFLSANPGYTLAFSPGIANVVSVPEPASAWLALCGLVLLGRWARSRQGMMGG